MFLMLLRPIFCEKLKIAPPPPIGKQPPLKRLNFRIWPKNQSQFRRRLFFFLWRSPEFGRKKPLNFGVRPKNQSQYFFLLCYFWRSPEFGRKKHLNFGRKISLNFGEDLFFFFGDHLILGGKKLRISKFPRNFV